MRPGVTWARAAPRSARLPLSHKIRCGFSSPYKGESSQPSVDADRGPLSLGSLSPSDPSYVGTEVCRTVRSVLVCFRERSRAAPAQRTAILI